jgi:hypothetical protein
MHERVLLLGQVRLPVSGFEARVDSTSNGVQLSLPFFKTNRNCKPDSDNIDCCPGMHVVYRIQGFVIGGE